MNVLVNFVTVLALIWALATGIYVVSKIGEPPLVWRKGERFITLGAAALAWVVINTLSLAWLIAWWIS